jgi:uncharacterized protein YkwD
LNIAVTAALACSAAHARVDADRVERIVVAETNQLRRDEGLAATGPDATLRRTAEAFAAFMARTGKYGHEADGRTPGERARHHGYDWCRVSENISYQWSSADFDTAELAQRLVDGWKKSPGHRRNMLDPDVTETAVAVARSAKSGKYYAVQMFGRARGARGC